MTVFSPTAHTHTHIKKEKREKKKFSLNSPQKYIEQKKNSFFFFSCYILSTSRRLKILFVIIPAAYDATDRNLSVYAVYTGRCAALPTCLPSTPRYRLPCHAPRWISSYLIAPFLHFSLPPFPSIYLGIYFLWFFFYYYLTVLLYSSNFFFLDKGVVVFLLIIFLVGLWPTCNFFFNQFETEICRMCWC